MHVTPEIKRVIEQKLRHGLELAEKRYGKKFPMPSVCYDLTGRTAGTANCKEWKIKLNGGLLMRNQEQFIERTPLHELAHLLNDRIYPEAHAHRPSVVASAGHKRRGKRQVHGPHWQEIMQSLGVADIKRCHSYDTSETRRAVTTYTYQCETCARQYKVGGKRHNKLVVNAHAYRCHCKGKIALVTANVPAKIAQQATNLKAPAPGSKLYACYEIYKTFHSVTTRQNMIALFVVKVGCTPAGASTYVATCKKLLDANAT